jgi:hypothetical protein
VQELAAVSAEVAAAGADLHAALGTAARTGPPAASALICHDQNPTHYAAAPDGRIAAMLDVEAHLWAPPEYELAMVELWIDDFAALRTAYERHAEWPPAYADVRGAYALATWMEWAYCLHTLLHDATAARALEARLPSLAAGFAKR